jgi:hypothetical protein
MPVEPVRLVRNRVAVRSALGRKVMPLDRSGKALADGLAGHVDFLADSEDGHTDLVARLEAWRVPR